MNKGWVPLGRSVFDSTIWENHSLFRLWIWCKQRASHSAVKFRAGYKEVCLQPGQVFFGTVQGPKDVGLSRQTFRTCVKILLAELHLTKIREITNQGTVYLFKDKFLTEKTGGELTSLQPTSNQPATTYKNDQEYNSLSARVRVEEEREKEESDTSLRLANCARELDFGLTPESALKALALGYPEDWIEKAMIEAALQNNRSFHYVRGILKRYKEKGGPDDNRHQGDHRKSRKTVARKTGGKYADRDAWASPRGEDESRRLDSVAAAPG